jgi:hypothetical protein
MRQNTTPAGAARAAQARPYPIVEMRELHRPERTGLLKLGPRARPDVPRPAEGHFVLVYKVGNRYVVDNMNLGPRDDKVINASQVSVVDLGRQTPVEVDVTIASKDHSFFTVVVTFACSVDDPVAVVQGGITDPGTILLTYLKNHHGYSQMGLGFSIAEINEARRYIDAQLTAYATVSEPEIEGMTVTMASVEVRTPEEELAKAAAQRQMRDWHVLENERVDLDGELRSHKQQTEHGIRRSDQGNAHELQVSAQANDQDLDYGQRRYRRLTADEEQVHAIRARQIARAAEEEERRYAVEARRQELEAELTRMGLTEDYRLNALRANAELLDDPTRALQLAYLSGHLTAAELAERMQAGNDHKHRLEQETTDRRHEIDRARWQDEAAERKEQLTFERAQQQAEVEARRAEATRQSEETRLEREVERARSNLQMLWERNDEVSAREAHEEREQRIYKAQVDLRRAAVDRGLLDSTSQNLDEFLSLGIGIPAERAQLPDQPVEPAGEADARDDRRERGE